MTDNIVPAILQEGKERSGGTSYERTDQARVRDRTYSSSQAIPILHRQVRHAHVWVE